MVGVTSNPARFGYGQSSTNDRQLFLDVFGGEVFAAFQERVLTLDKHNVRSISNGRSARFPKTWKATSEYHTAGRELLGNDIETGEVTITIDGLLVAHTAIYDLDEKMSHFDVTSEFSSELGRALAREFDLNVMRAVIQASREAADGPFPAGNQIVDAALENSGTITGIDWVDAIRAANIALFNKDVPEDMPRWMLVNADVFDAIKYAVDANGHYLVLNRDFNNGHSVAGRPAESIVVDGVTVYKQRTIPSTDESADTNVFSKYRADYSGTKGVMWCRDAVGTVKLMDIAMETERDVRRQEDFMVSKMAVGHGHLRPECAVEFRKVAL